MKRRFRNFIICIFYIFLLAIPIIKICTIRIKAVGTENASQDVIKKAKKIYQMNVGTSKNMEIIISKNSKIIKYISNNPKVVSVSKKGTIKAKRTGTAKITTIVRTGQKSKKIWIKVKVSEPTSRPEQVSESKPITDAKEKTKNNKMKITIGNTVFTATLVDNSSVKALKELLAQEPLTINMSDYANMEKVGLIDQSLPRDDKQITTEPGDIILYQGNSLVIYYDTNSWKLTRIGKIEDITQEELLEVLGDGNVTVTFSLK